LAVVLVQFPPGRNFNGPVAEALFEAFRVRTSAALVCEPRHASWFTADVEYWLAERRIARAATDAWRLAGPALGAAAWFAAHLLFVLW
jgi:uncharacterized protein YecE (DUF72 family)